MEQIKNGTNANADRMSSTIKATGKASQKSIDKFSSNLKKSGGNTDTRPSLDDVLDDYQVVDDDMVKYLPKPAAIADLFIDSEKMTATEGELLDQLQSEKGVGALTTFEDIRQEVYDAAEDNYKGDGAEDGRQDAFRHMYWNALMTKRFGEDFTKSFTIAHEGKPDNPADQEAMDLFNNEVGRRIAVENPDATDQELADLIKDAISNGEGIVIDKNGELAYSDYKGPTGSADDAPKKGKIHPPEYTGSN
jgi:hypothetical protein